MSLKLISLLENDQARQGLVQVQSVDDEV